jgi:hypothetical protein
MTAFDSGVHPPSHSIRLRRLLPVCMKSVGDSHLAGYAAKSPFVVLPAATYRLDAEAPGFKRP